MRLFTDLTIINGSIKASSQKPINCSLSVNSKNNNNKTL